MSDFENKEKNIRSFMEMVEDERNIADAPVAHDPFHDTTTYKLRVLDKEKEKAKDHCLNHICCKIYRDALPLSDEYKNACKDDIDDKFREFISQKCPKGLEFYIHECIKKDVPFAKRLMEAVDNVVNKEYKDKEFNIADIPAEDLVFNSSEVLQKKLDVVGDELQGSEIAQAIRDNVVSTAMSEITRAKEEKQKVKDLETSLANDIKMVNKEDIEEAVALTGLFDKKAYVPTLFEGVNIAMIERCGENYDGTKLSQYASYNALSPFGKDLTEGAEVSDGAFVDTVMEYTALSLLKATKFESFTRYETENLAQEYAMGKLNK